MSPLTTSAQVVKHSVSRGGSPIITLSLVYPRFIHSEAKTHRALSIDGEQYELQRDISLMNQREFSRSAMSSRAVPVAKMIEQVRTAPATPAHWGANQPGMQANGEIDRKGDALALWNLAASQAADVAERMNDLGLHKQVVNRLLEPFQWMRTIVTSTEWDNFFSLRLSPMAEPNMRDLAECMRNAIETSVPIERDFHMPYFDDIEFIKIAGDVNKACMISAARCARVSYLNHDGSMPDIDKDLALGELLKSSNHASPFEHVAIAAGADFKSRNFTGWTQYRETLGL